MTERRRCNDAWRAATLAFLLATASTGFAGAARADAHAKDTSAGDVKAQVEEAARAVESYTADQRDEAVRKVRSALDAVDARMDVLRDRLEAEGETMSAAAKRQTRAALRELREQREKVAEWYGALKHSSTSAWEHVKHGFADAYRSLLDSLAKAEEEH